MFCGELVSGGEVDQEVKLRSQASGRFINDCASHLGDHCMKVEFQSMSARVEGTFIPEISTFFMLICFCSS